MLFKKIFPLLVIAFLFSCSKESEQPFEITGTIKGKISLLSEFGQPESDQNNATVTITDGKNSIQTLSDASGNYVIDKIKSGTYAVTVEKDGFVKLNFIGIGLAGGGEPYYFNTSLPKPSSNIITNLNMNYSSGQLTLTGTTNNIHPNNFPIGLLFIGKSPDVSPQNHVDSFIFFSNGFYDQFSITTKLNSDDFPKGTTIYVVAYGMSLFHLIYNIETDRYEYPAAGKIPSNIVSALIE